MRGQTFRGTPSSSVKARKNALSLNIDHVPVLSLIKTVSSCVVQIVCVITNQGSRNPNCLNFIINTSVLVGVPINPIVFVLACTCTWSNTGNLIERPRHTVIVARLKQ